MNTQETTIAIDGLGITLESGTVARQANGSVILRCGDMTILATACASKEPKENVDFLPLRIDHQERFSAIGSAPGGYLKRAGRPSTREILTSRLIDRPLRPMFPAGFHNEIQVLTYVLSYDKRLSPESFALTAASAALVLSDIPLLEPVASVQVGMINDEIIINPTLEQQEESKLDLLLAGTEKAILMIEGYCDFLTEDQVLDAISQGHEKIQLICQKLSDWALTNGKEKMTPTLTSLPSDLLDEIETKYSSSFSNAFSIKDKMERDEKLQEINSTISENHASDKETKYSSEELKLVTKKVRAKILRNKILKEKKRPDHRNPTQIRNISIQQSFLKRTHGSSLFTRGETQSIVTCTMGPESIGQKYENIVEGDSVKRFNLDYFFPPYSVGEVGRVGPAARREVGHGNLAERALKATLPKFEDFPYAIRIESNITESNGSSSMASVCGGSLAMMDAGVPIKNPVAGIAMGLILEDDQFVILSDILGVEDALGDMDFKITGDANGITAFQMDIKIEGITQDIMKSALMQARDGRLHILQEMHKACPSTSTTLSKYAPKISTLKVPTSKIAIVIGGGGKTIKSIIEASGATVDINDTGEISVSSDNQDSINTAINMIKNLVEEPEVGKVYDGIITKLQAFGAFVKTVGTNEGLLHISEIAHERVTKVEDHLKEGQQIKVKVLEINDRGQIRLSHKALLDKPNTPKEALPSKKAKIATTTTTKKSLNSNNQSTVTLIKPPNLVKLD